MRRPWHGIIALGLMTAAPPADAAEVRIIDARHYSRVFGELRQYRIFLPPDYDAQADRRYPVIYFFHGWSERYFGSTMTAA